MSSITDHLIADYLRRKGYIETLKSFESQSGVNSATSVVQYEDLESIVNDRINYLEHKDNIIKASDASTNNTVENSHLFKKWNDSVPKTPKQLHTSNKSLIVHISVSSFKIGQDGDLKDVLFITSSDKKLNLVNIKTGDLIGTYDNLHNSVGKCCYAIPGTNRILSCGMDGKIKLFELSSGDRFELVSEMQLHKRVITDLRLFVQGDQLLIFSIGWDLLLKVTRISTKTDQFEPLSSFKLLSNATAIEIGELNKLPIVLITRLDSSQLAYFTLLQDKLIEVTKISLNDAEFSTHGFTPMTISLSRKDLGDPSTLVGIGTSHIPYMRIIITKLPNLAELIESLQKDIESRSNEQQLSTPVLRGFIVGNFNSLSPQDKYSQAKILWRTDTSGIWISGDEGLIRGIEFKNGEIIEVLKNGHEQRIKCLLNYEVDGQEVLISSGIDKKLFYWYK